MTTVAELTDRARQLKLSGYSKLKKSQLEELIREEERRLEDEKLRKIREADSPAKLAPSPFSGFNPSLPLSVETIEILARLEKTHRSLGISNRIRIGHYLAAQPGRKHLTPAQARRVRRKWSAGDNSVPDALVYSTSLIRSFL